MTQKMDGIEFQMGEPFDFGFLERYGRVLRCSTTRTPAI